MSNEPPVYVFGHSDRELERLRVQARLINPITRRFFIDAGIAAGLRVLDVGSGAGDVAFLAAELVGETGEVVGIDRSGAALATARGRAEAQGLRNVTFVEGDPAEVTFDSPFDVAVGRYVLQFQADPPAMLRAVTRHVRPGGVIVFHECDWDGTASFPAAPIHDQCCEWWRTLLQRSGTEHRMGRKLHAAFVGAGLGVPVMHREAIIGGGEACAEYLRVGIADLFGSVIEDMEKLGVATASEIGIDTLGDRLVAEAIANGSVIIGRSEMAAWARV